MAKGDKGYLLSMVSDNLAQVDAPIIPLHNAAGKYLAYQPVRLENSANIYVANTDIDGTGTPIPLVVGDGANEWTKYGGGLRAPKVTMYAGTTDHATSISFNAHTHVFDPDALYAEVELQGPGGGNGHVTTTANECVASSGGGAYIMMRSTGPLPEFFNMEVGVARTGGYTAFVSSLTGGYTRAYLGGDPVEARAGAGGTRFTTGSVTVNGGVGGSLYGGSPENWEWVHSRYGEPGRSSYIRLSGGALDTLWAVGGAGGGSLFGHGGLSRLSTVQSSGASSSLTPTGYGAGAAGILKGNSSTGTSCKLGRPGFVKVTEYFH